MPYQMKNGKWRGEKIINGKRRTASFATKSEAKKWEAMQSAAAWQAEACAIPIISWHEFLTAYLDTAKERFSHKTYNEKRLAARQALQIVPPDQAANSITSAQAAAILRIAAKTSGNAANKTRKNLSAAWAWGKRYHNLPAINPFLEAEKYAADQHPRSVPCETDFWKVYAVANQEDKDFLLFLLHTGARVGEAFRLVWEDMDFENGRVRLGTRKTAHGGMQYAWLPMTERLKLAMLEKRKRQPFSRHVFTQNNGQPFTSRQHLMPQLCERAGVKPFGFHGIRHLSATLLAYAGLDLPTVQAMLRHSSPTTTARYIKSLGIDKNKIEGVFAEKGPAKITQFEEAKKAIPT